MSVLAVVSKLSSANLTRPDALPAGTDGITTHQLGVEKGIIAFDDTGGSGPLVIAVPGMGDLRSEYRYLTPHLVAAGYRVVTVDIEDTVRAARTGTIVQHMPLGGMCWL